LEHLKLSIAVSHLPELLRPFFPIGYTIMANTRKKLLSASANHERSPSRVAGGSGSTVGAGDVSPSNILPGVRTRRGTTSAAPTSE